MYFYTPIKQLGSLRRRRFARKLGERTQEAGTEPWIAPGVLFCSGLLSGSGFVIVYYSKS